MADEGGTGERTEEATPKKREDARKEGNVLKSQEVVTIGSLVIMLAALRGLMPTLAENLMTMTRGYVLHVATELTAQSVVALAQDVVLSFIQLMLPLLGVAVIAAVLLSGLQTGFLFSTKAMGIKMSRLNPIEGFKRMFSVRTLFELVKAIAKTALVGVIIYIQITSNMDYFANLMIEEYQGAIQKVAEIVLDAAIMISAVLGGIAGLDFFFQRWKYNKDLRMSKYEVKMEMKQQEGDPQIKGKIRQKQREMSTMRMMQEVPDADVVITNPTEYAVALKYDEKIGDAPMVVAKGKERVAQKIKEIARENAVEIVEDKPLARSLFAYCEIGAFIPVDLYQAVAQILAQVFKAKNRR
ncbi:flagellar biosynthesis protein FlhB [Christensenellaceae bacterium OttesenSCG-928-K19]|nr:flagellar biosynthesis protein FlhB [Christensenellaceae bacterium OttesenSCG-928-K19]